jgi:GAF domain
MDGNPNTEIGSASPIAGVRAAWDSQPALQLLANRACFITGARQAVIALGEGNVLVCKASSGPTAPVPGTLLQLDGGPTSELMAECVSTRTPVRCQNTATDNRTDIAVCRPQAIGSVLLAPLLRAGDVIGTFELIAERNFAFEERDIESLQRLAAMAVVALEQDGASTESSKAEVVETTVASAPVARKGRIPLPANASAEPIQEEAARLAGSDNARRCKGCGFPVSAGRTVCLDCEAEQIARGTFGAHDLATFSYGSSTAGKKSWLDEHFYTIGIILVSLLTVIILILWAR